MTDSLTVFGTDYTGVTGIKAHKTSDSSLQAYIKPEGNLAITQNTASGSSLDVSQYATATVNVSGGGSPNLQSKSKSYTPTETAQSETVSADSGYDGLSSVDISVGAISSSYVGSGITRRDSTDLTASGATVSVPSGYYASNASKSVSSGTEGTPTATKGTVSNHSVNVTPSVTNSAGYINGGTHSGTSVSVSASELVSGTKSITTNGTAIDVTNYAAVDVAVPSDSPSLQSKSKSYTPTTSQQSETVSADGGYDGLSSVAITVAAMPSGSVIAPSTITGSSATVSTGTNTLTLSKTVSVTPNVTTAGYVSSGTAGNSNVSLTASVTTQGAQTIHPSTTQQTIASGRYLTGTQTIAPVTTTNLTADNIKQGVTVQVGDASDSDRVASVTGTYSGGGGSSKAVYIYEGLAERKANSYGATNAKVTVAKAGTYSISYVAVRGSSSGTMGTNLYIGSTTGTNNQTFNNGTYGQYVKLTGQTISANTTVTIYATSGSNSRSLYVGQLVVQEE